MINKIGFLLLFILSFLCFSYASSTNSAVFLRIDSSARTASLGGVGSAIYGDVSNIEQNPASLYWVDRKQVFVSHNEWFDGVRSEYFAYAHPFGSHNVFSVSGKYLYIDGLNRTDNMGSKIGTFTSNDSVCSVNFMRAFNSRFAFGAALKLINQSIDNNSGSAIATDFGVLYNTTRYLTLAVSVKNMGSDLAIYKEAFQLPLTYTFGVAYYLKKSFNIGLDIDKEINSDYVYKTGVEYLLSKNINLRFGYVSSSQVYAGSGLTFGFGFNLYSNIYIDYAYVPYGDLGNTNRFSFKYIF